MYAALVKRLQSWLVTGGQTRQLLAVLVLCLLVGIAGGALFVFLGPLLTVAVLVAPFTLGSAALGLGLLVLTALPRRSIARPQPSAWFVVPMATAGVATAFHVLTLAPRPPPSF